MPTQFVPTHPTYRPFCGRAHTLGDDRVVVAAASVSTAPLGCQPICISDDEGDSQHVQLISILAIAWMWAMRFE